MSEKAKRKGNPRRRVLWQALLLLGVITGGLGAMWWTMQQRTTDRFIYFIKNEVFNYQLHISNGDHSAQSEALTASEHGIRYGSASLSGDGRILTYIEGHEYEDYPLTIWRHDLVTGEQDSYMGCECRATYPNEDGSWIIYHSVTILDGRASAESILYQFETDETRSLDDIVANSDDSTYQVQHRMFWWHLDNRLRFILEPPTPFIRSDATESLKLVEYDLATEELTVLSEWNLDDFPNVLYSLGYSLRGWHPDGEHLIVAESDLQASSPTPLNLYNIYTGDSHLLMTVPARHEATMLDFSEDETHLLYTLRHNDYGEIQIVIRDLVTGDEDILPIDGTLAQWIER